jgi:hypothetical protein
VRLTTPLRLARGTRERGLNFGPKTMMFSHEEACHSRQAFFFPHFDIIHFMDRRTSPRNWKSPRHPTLDFIGYSTGNRKV